MVNQCFNCKKEGNELYRFIVCDSCKKELRLFTPKTINKHIEKFSKEGYELGVKEKLDALEMEYIKKKIKLLDILDKLKK